MSEVHGIDTNLAQDWSAYKRAGNVFAGIKATEGLDYLSPAFRPSWDQVYHAGLGRIAYHFGHPGEDPGKQAAFFANIMKNAGTRPGEKLALDLEVTDGLEPNQVSFWAWVFCTELERLMPHCQVKIYTFPAFAEAGNCARLGRWPLWLAHWDVPRPVVPAPWSTWRIWQYAQGHAPGPDLDVFNGTLAEAEEFFLLKPAGM